MSDMGHQTLNIRRLTSDIRHWTSDIRHWTSHIRHVDKVVNFNNFSRPIIEIKYFILRTLSEFKDFLRRRLKFKTFSRMYEPCSHSAARAPRRACSPANVFKQRTSTERGVFALFGHDFEQNLGQIISLNVKTLSDTNLKEPRHIKRKKGSLLVDIRRCLNSLVLPITYHFSTQNNDLLVLKQWKWALNWILPLRLGTRAMCLPK